MTFRGQKPLYVVGLASKKGGDHPALELVDSYLANGGRRASNIMAVWMHRPEEEGHKPWSFNSAGLTSKKAKRTFEICGSGISNYMGYSSILLRYCRLDKSS